MTEIFTFFLNISLQNCNFLVRILVHKRRSSMSDLILPRIPPTITDCGGESKENSRTASDSFALPRSSLDSKRQIFNPKMLNQDISIDGSETSDTDDRSPSSTSNSRRDSGVTEHDFFNMFSGKICN